MQNPRSVLRSHFSDRNVPQPKEYAFTVASKRAKDALALLPGPKSHVCCFDSSPRLPAVQRMLWLCWHSSKNHVCYFHFSPRLPAGNGCFGCSGSSKNHVCYFDFSPRLPAVQRMLWICCPDLKKHVCCLMFPKRATDASFIACVSIFNRNCHRKCKLRPAMHRLCSFGISHFFRTFLRCQNGCFLRVYCLCLGLQ